MAKEWRRNRHWKTMVKAKSENDITQNIVHTYSNQDFLRLMVYDKIWRNFFKNYEINKAHG